MSKKTVFLMSIAFCCILAVAIGLCLPSNGLIEANAAGGCINLSISLNAFPVDCTCVLSIGSSSKTITLTKSVAAGEIYKATLEEPADLLISLQFSNGIKLISCEEQWDSNGLPLNASCSVRVSGSSLSISSFNDAGDSTALNLIVSCESVACTYCSGTGLYQSEECPVCHGVGSYDASVAAETHTFSCTFTTSSTHSGYIVLNGVKQDSDSCQISVGDKIQIYTTHFDPAATSLSGSSDSFDVYSFDFSVICQDIDYTEDGFLVPVGSVSLKYTFLIVAPEVEKTYDVTFVLIDNSTQVTKSLTEITQDVCDSVWAEWKEAYPDLDLTEKYWILIQKSGTSYGSTLPFTVDSADYVVAMESLFPVTFEFPNGSTKVDRLDYITQSVIDDMWSEWSTANNYSWGYSRILAYNGQVSDSVTLEYPLAVLYKDLHIVFIPYSYKVTFDLNLPEGVTGYGVGEIAENGDYNDASVMYEAASAVSFGSSIVSTTVLNCASVVGIGCYKDWATLSETCIFLGWAFSPTAGADDVVIPSSCFKEQLVEGTSYVNLIPDTSKVGGVVFITQETTFYAVYDVLSISVVFECNGGELVGDYSDSFSVYETVEFPEPIKENCEFVGWFYDEACTVICNPEISINVFYISDDYILTLYASYTSPGLNFCYVDSNDKLIYLESSINSLPVHYDMAASITIEGFPFIPTIGQSDEVACYIWDAGVYWIVFYPFVVEIRKPVPIESLFYLSYYGQEWDEHDGVSSVYPTLETYSYPFTLQCSHYDISIDCDYDVEALLVDPSVIPEKLRSYSDSWLSLWGESYQLKSDSSYEMTSYFYGRCRLNNSLLINDTYSLSYLLGLAGFKGSLIFAAVTGDFVRQDRSTSDPAIMENNTSGGTSSGNLIFYCNDDSTNAYLDGAKIDKTVISGNSSNSSSSNKTTSDFFNTIFEYLTKLLILVIVVFVMILVFKIIFLRTHF